MIQLHPDCLVFELSSGEAVPCSAETVTVELMGEAATLVDPDVVHNAASAVLHYFKSDLGRSSVSVGEFAQALAHVLRAFGLEVTPPENPHAPVAGPEFDLRQLACGGAKGFELAFFPLLRNAFRDQLRQSPSLVRFRGLRGCVKQLAGAKRWNGHCQRLHEQIVEYLRQCLIREPGKDPRALLVR